MKDLQKYDRFCKLIRHGKLEDGRIFCVMQLLGSNLTKYKKLKSQSLQVKEIIHIARDILESIQEMHSLGYVHRDIKPGNCAIRKKRGDGLPQWTLLDFGLSRKLVNDDGVQIEERKDASFRGSVSYASINAHNDKDLSWRDDLWSWLYSVVDLLQGMFPHQCIGFYHRTIIYFYLFHAGDLPWKTLACEHVSSTSGTSPIAMLKKECLKDPSLMFPRGSMYLSQIAQINEYIGKLGFTDIPDYRYLKDILDSMTQSDVPEGRKETKDNHSPIPDESDTLNKSCTGDGTMKRSHQTLSELIAVLQEVCVQCAIQCYRLLSLSNVFFFHCRVDTPKKLRKYART